MILLEETALCIPKLSRYKLRGLTAKDVLVTKEIRYDPFLFTGKDNESADRQVEESGLLVATTTKLANQGKSQSNAGVSSGEQHVEVPTWRIKPLTSLYALERTEPFDDETFAERHRKLEADEKRRKRWDMERTRQMLVNRRLENRHRETIGLALLPDDDRVVDAVSRTAGVSQVPSAVAHLKTELERAKRCTFRANPFASTHRVEFVEVTDSLPICAFGLPLAAMKRTDYR